MKRFALILLALLPLVASAQSALYRHYAGRDNLTVAEVSGFRLNDSVKVDVLILVADDDKAWDKLCAEHNIRGREGVTSWLGDAAQPATRKRWDGKPCRKAVASHERRTLCFYMLTDRRQYDALADFQMNKIDNK
ncbi:MAG: hypothetical protein IJ760_05350 [Bacteroidales bacterium]|nr:hypothetical protein [Bacteroidales bacterium]